MQPSQISIGVICPLPIEAAAMMQMLDDRYETQQFAGDPNLYHLGRIGTQNIVIAGLPEGLTGIASASIVADRLYSTFKCVKAMLLVGIGGGVWTAQNGMRLGDVVVSRPDGNQGGVVQYDFGKSLSEGRFEYTGALNSPPREVLATLAALKANHLLRGAQLPDFRIYLEASQSNPHLKEPGLEHDVLFDSDYVHIDGSDCTHCDKARQIKREPREIAGPIVHYGTIASANQLMRDARKRDQYNRDYHGRILCFEMEAAGLMNSVPCLAIRGISDYADSHKRQDHAWHGYAAAAAAALAKEFINTIPSGDLDIVVPIVKSLSADDVLKKPWLVPFQRNPNFVGRESQLEKLSAMLSSEDICQRAAVVGLGGIGKTQIALEFAYRKRKSYPECSIFWVATNSPTTFDQAYLKIGQLLQIPKINEENADVKQLVKMKLSQENIGQWLLIFDNADDIDVLYKRSYSENGSLALIDYLPSSRNGSIIFTTRNRKAAVKQAGRNLTEVAEMNEVDAKEILEKSLYQSHVLEDDQATVKLLELLTYLPLAITQAAAFINANDMSISSYIALYENGEAETIELLSEDFEDQGRYNDIKNPIATTWLISFNQISSNDALAADYLSFMSCLVSQGIPESLLPTATSKVKTAAAIGTLTAYSFIKKRDSEESFDLHRLVHLATRNWLRTNQSLETWTEKVLSRLAKIFPMADHKNKSIWLTYLPHARYVLASPLPPNGNKVDEARLLYKVGWCLTSNGQYRAAEQMYRQAVELRENFLGPEHPDTLESKNELASVLRRLGKYDEAEKMHRLVLTIRTRILGLECLDTLRSMNGLASVLISQGNYAEAEVMHQHTLELRTKVLGPEHTDTLRSMNDLALVRRRLGKYVEAEQIYRETLELRQKVSGPEHPSTLTSISELASVLRRLGKYSEAEQMHRKTLELRIKVSGPEHPHTLMSLSQLALVLSSQHKYDEAEELGRRTLELRQRILGIDHPDTLTSMNNLAWSLSDKGNFVAAKDMLDQTLAFRERVLGLDHPLTKTSRDNYNFMLKKVQKYEDRGDAKLMEI